MAEAKILVEGYASTKNNRATSTAVLIIDGDVKLIVDPGMDRKKLLDGLDREKLSPANIGYVIQSHGHIDHVGLTALFENATIVDDESLYTFDGGFSEHHGKIPHASDDIAIFKTPGHQSDHTAISVKTKDGVVVIAADVFWWYDEETQSHDKDALMNRHDEWAKNEVDLQKSRAEVFKLADYIIPGHGKMFKVKK